MMVTEMTQENQQIFERFPFYQEETYIYFNTLFYFVDYLLQTPTTLRLEYRKAVKKIMKVEDDHMHIEKEQLPPIVREVVEMIQEEELEKVRKQAMEEGKVEGKAAGREEGQEEGKVEGREEIKVMIATELIKDGFQDEKVAQLTGLELEQVIEMRKTL